MAQNDGQERTEQPTPKRLQEAREKGQIARSRELNTMVLLLAAATAMLLLGGNIMRQLQDLFKASFGFERSLAFDEGLLFKVMINYFTDALIAIFPFFLTAMFAALFSPMALGGWSFSVSSLAFNPGKLDPIAGLGRIFGWKGVVELLKALAKFLLLASVGIMLLWFNIDDFMMLTYEPLEASLSHVALLLLQAFFLLASILILVAAIDVPFQLWDHNRQLKMTRQEIKDEYKQTEGSPELKSKVRNMQLENARRRMMEEVPKADVVITNPTHYAVALRYEQLGMGAPQVVAKGRGLIAANIRELAQEHEIAIMSAPPLARALYHCTELGQEIPAGLYMAVAQVLAYVYQLKRYQTGEGVRPSPIPVDELPIPDDLKKD